MLYTTRFYWHVWNFNNQMDMFIGYVAVFNIAKDALCREKAKDREIERERSKSHLYLNDVQCALVVLLV